MDQWFGIKSEHLFQSFSASHLIALAIAIGGLILLLVTCKRWKSYPKAYQLVRWLLFTLLLISELSYLLWTQVNNIWSFEDHTPLHLCGLASILAMLALIFKNNTLIQLSFFFGIVPAFLAIVTPDLPYDYQHYRFWKFFVHHTVIPWACLFLALSHPQIITFNALVKSYMSLLVYALFIGFIINPMTGANYLYLGQTPAANTPLDLLGSGVWYYFNLCLTALAVFTGQYMLWRRFIRR